MPRPIPEAPPVTTATRPFTLCTSAAPSHLVLVLPPFGGADLVGRGHECDVLPEIAWRRADGVRDRRERVEVEPIATRRGLTQHLARIADGDVTEVALQAGHGVRPRPFGMRVVR